jgi:protein SCO1/2
MDAGSEAEFAARVGALAADPATCIQLPDLLREDNAVYAQRSTAATTRMRGWVLATMARTGLSEDGLFYVLEELDTGINPYTVAAAARALRSYPRPMAAFAPYLVQALGNIRYHDEPVTFEQYGEYATSTDDTTAIGELLAALEWLGLCAAPVVTELEALRSGNGLRKYAARIDAIVAALTAPAPAQAGCCEVPSVLWWPDGRRKGSGPVEAIVFEDHSGTRRTFAEIFHGRPSIVAFFYTRCENPLKCSLTVAKLARIQTLLAVQGLRHRIGTAAITYDPAFDTPNRLRRYGEDRGIQLDDGHRMLRAVDGMDILGRHCRLGVNYVESLVNRHQIEIFIFDRTGAIAASFQRLRWSEEDVLTRAVAVLHESPQTSPDSAPPSRTLSTLATLSTLILALLPKCPMCWAAYMSVFGIAGIERLSFSNHWTVVLLLAFVLVNLLSVWMRTCATGRLFAFGLVATGALSVCAAAVRPEWKIASVAGVILTTAGSLASAWRGIAMRKWPLPAAR